MPFSELDKDRIVARWRALFGVYNGHDNSGISIDFDQAEEMIKLAQWNPLWRQVEIVIPARKLLELCNA